MNVCGKVWKYGNDINTDYIYPGEYLYSGVTDEEMGKYAMSGIDPDFVENATRGDIIVAGKNWGCGSSREQAVVCLKSRGIAAIVVESASRIHFRNAFNHALPIIVCPDAVKTTQAGEIITIDTDAGTITNASGCYKFPPFNGHINMLLEAGGLLPYTKRCLNEENKG